MFVDEIARVCHEANRGLQALHPQSGIPVSAAWEDETEELRASVIAGVESAIAGATPEQLHQGWCDLKEDEGWVWGPIKDVEQKTHPCLMSYELLPEEQRRKDELFHAIVRALAPKESRSRFDCHEVLVHGAWRGEEAPRRVELDGTRLQRVLGYSVQEDVDNRPFSVVTLQLHSDRVTLLPASAE